MWRLDALHRMFISFPQGTLMVTLEFEQRKLPLCDVKYNKLMGTGVKQLATKIKNFFSMFVLKETK